MARFCAVDGCHGIYVPQVFVERYRSDLRMDDQNELNELSDIILSGPEHEEYWDAWDDLIASALVVIDGKEYSIEMDNDVFLCDGEPDEDDEWEEEEGFL